MLFNSKSSAAALSVASNTVLIILKLVVGISMGSVSVISEAIHSSVDLLAALIAFFSVRAAARPADEGHPFGHGKIENVSGTVEAVLIFFAAMLIIYEAIQKLIYGVHIESLGLGIGVMAFSAIANIVVSRQLLRVSKATGSVALEADAYHLTTDVLTSVGVMAGLTAVRVTGLEILDPFIAIAVALAIVKAAWDITHKAFVDLLDRRLPDEERRVIESVLSKHSDLMIGYHGMRSRKAGPLRYVDLHLVVDGSKSVEEAHRLCDHLEEEVEQALPNTDLVIHLEPHARTRSA
ncbi:MAG: cation diffusion facilitator family transporter [Bacteroidetes bacterium]|nr:cation diffusion facilitator family transporter [Bacteroidota bacterium]MCL5025495.1 cation diffusion facilitator family transporter [Chloroflexota bacterium]